MSESDVDAEPILISLSLAPWVTRLPIDSLRVAFGVAFGNLRFLPYGTEVSV